MNSHPVQVFENRTKSDVRVFWAATRAESGRIFGSNQGLVELVGGEWRRLTTEGDFEWQTLYPDDRGRIWSAAATEFGVYEPDAGGVLHYRSLTALIPESAGGIGDTWGIHPFDESVVFVGRGSILKTNGHAAELWELPCERRLYSWIDNGALYIADEGEGVYRMTHNGPVAVSPPTAGKSKRYFWSENLTRPDWILSTHVGFETAESGASGTFSELNKVWLGAAAVQQTRLEDGRLAVATYFGGLFLVDTATGAFEQLSLSEGLSSAAVLGLYPEGGRWLWLATNRGVDRVAISGAVATLRNGSGIDGVVLRGVERKGSEAIITTDSGRFAVPLTGPASEIRQLGQRWFHGLARLGSETLAGGFEGLFSIDGEQTKRVIFEADDVESIVVPANSTDLIIYSTGPAVRAAVRRDGRLLVTATEEMGAYIESMVEDPNGDLLVAAGGRVSRLSLAATGDRFVERASHSIPDHVRSTTARTKLFAVGQSVFGICDGVLLAIDPGGHALLPVSTLEGVEFVGAASARDGVAWALARPQRHPAESPRLVRLSLGGTELVAEEMDAPGVLTLGTLRNIHYVEAGTGSPEIWIGASEGILRVDPAHISAVKPSPALALSTTRTGPDAADRVYTGDTILNYRENALAFEWSGPGTVAGDLMVETRLVGADERWLPAGSATTREFAGLGDGDYVFEARAIDAVGRPGPIVSRVFTILPPWYRTTGSLVGFGVSAIVIAAAGWMWRSRAMRRRAEELEGLVESRTRELERVNAEKTRFIARMNHEIRNPLNGLLGAIGILEHSESSKTGSRMIQILRACADHLGAVVEDVLDFSNIEGGKIVLQDRAYSVASMVEAVPRMLVAEAERTGTEVSVRISPDVPPVAVGDPDRIRQILVNFLANALKYAPGEPVQLEVSVVEVESAPWLRFAVRDHGPGISEADKQALFSMFERGREGMRRNARGMGIGLATSRLLARRMGGEVGVISGLGEGSEFFLRLPLKVESAAVSGEGTGLPELGRLTCLIIDDQEFNRIVLRNMLERLGCSVDEAAEIDTALGLASLNRYDVVFTDLDLPGAAPGEILKRLVSRRPAAGEKAPALVVTTAYATENVRQTCLAAGAHAFLPKPLAANKVAEVLRQIDGARMPTTAAHTEARGSSEGARGGAFLNHLASIRNCEPGVVAAEVASNITAEVEAIGRGVRNSNVREVAQQAHRLLSIAALADSPALAAEAAAIQNDAREGRLPGAMRIASLARAAVDARTRLAAVISSGAAGGQNRGPGHNESTASSRSD